MFSLSSILSTLTTAVIFVIAFRYITRALAEKGIPGGILRGLLVIFLASVIALFAGSAVDWASEPHPSAINKAQ